MNTGHAQAELRVLSGQNVTTRPVVLVYRDVESMQKDAHLSSGASNLGGGGSGSGNNGGTGGDGNDGNGGGGYQDDGQGGDGGGPRKYQRTDFGRGPGGGPGFSSYSSEDKFAVIGGSVFRLPPLKYYGPEESDDEPDMDHISEDSGEEEEEEREDSGIGLGLLEAEETESAARGQQTFPAVDKPTPQQSGPDDHGDGAGDDDELTKKQFVSEMQVGFWKLLQSPYAHMLGSAYMDGGKQQAKSNQQQQQRPGCATLPYMNLAIPILNAQYNVTVFTFLSLLGLISFTILGANMAPAGSFPSMQLIQSTTNVATQAAVSAQQFRTMTKTLETVQLNSPIFNTWWSTQQSNDFPIQSKEGRDFLGESIKASATAAGAMSELLHTLSMGSSQELLLGAGSPLRTVGATSNGLNLLDRQLNLMSTRAGVHSNHRLRRLLQEDTPKPPAPACGSGWQNGAWVVDPDVQVTSFVATGERHCWRQAKNTATSGVKLYSTYISRSRECFAFNSSTTPEFDHSPRTATRSRCDTEQADSDKMRIQAAAFAPAPTLVGSPMLTEFTFMVVSRMQHTSHSSLKFETYGMQSNT